MNSKVFVFITFILFVAIIAIVIVSWYNFRLKKRIIDSGPIDDGALNFLRKLTDMGTEQLKWGCVLFAGGLGLVVNQFLPMGDDSPMPWGVEIMFIAAGFLTYYFIINRKQHN